MSGDSIDANVAQIRARVILLGASNVALGFSTIVDAVRRALPGPLEIFTAFGHGRSYGMTTRVLARRIGGIRECGLWDAIRSRPELPTYALVTDVGNDVAYGVAPELIVEWIVELIERVRGQRVVVTGLPLESIESMARWKFVLVRTVLFPGKLFSHESVVERARAVDDALSRRAPTHGFEFVRPRRDWYGFDPIHIRRPRRREAWEGVVSSWSEQPAPSRPPDRARLVNVAPARRWIFGREERERQPCLRLADGTTIWAY